MQALVVADIPPSKPQKGGCAVADPDGATGLMVLLLLLAIRRARALRRGR